MHTRTHTHTRTVPLENIQLHNMEYNGRNLNVELAKPESADHPPRPPREVCSIEREESRLPPKQ